MSMGKTNVFLQIREEIVDDPCLAQASSYLSRFVKDKRRNQIN